jgi:catechol 2,3-dioxygenase
MNLLTTPSINPHKARDFSRTVIPFTNSPNRVKRDHIVSPKREECPTTIRLGHVHLKVRALHRALPFYRDILGLRLTERVGRFAFLAGGSEHHCVALEEVGPWTSFPPRSASGVAHVAFELPGRADFAAMRNSLLAARVPIISRNNGISWTMRFKDPDLNEIEIYVDRRHTTGAPFWRGRWYEPFRLEDGTAPNVSRQRREMEVKALAARH